MIELQFDSTGQLIGAKLRHYLLERTRVVCQSYVFVGVVSSLHSYFVMETFFALVVTDFDERNFHIFYFIFAGADKTEREKCCIYKSQDYYYTNQTNVFELPGIDSQGTYDKLKSALQTVGLSSQETFNVIKLMCAVLWLGNIDFDENASKYNR